MNTDSRGRTIVYVAELCYQQGPKNFLSLMVTDDTDAWPLNLSEKEFAWLELGWPDFGLPDELFYPEHWLTGDTITCQREKSNAPLARKLNLLLK